MAAWAVGSAVLAAVLSLLLVRLLTPAETPPAAAPGAPAPSAPAGGAGVPAGDEPVDVGDRVGTLVLAPDGSRVYATSDRGITVLDAATRATIGTIGTAQTPQTMRLSADGRRLFVPSSDGLQVLDLAQNLVVDTIALPDPYDTYVDTVLGTDPDGGVVYVVAGSNPAALLRVDLAARSAEPVVETGRSDVVLSPDATTAWLGSDPGAGQPVRVVDLADGAVTPVAGTEEATDIALSPTADGPVYVFDYDERIEIDPVTRTAGERLPWLGSYVDTVLVDPDAARLYAVGSTDGRVLVFDPAAYRRAASGSTRTVST